jgi:CRP-like cAMP-binding protein
MYHNVILDKLNSLHPAFLTGHLKHLSFQHGDHLSRAGEAIDRVFFPRSGLISIVVELADGDSIETAMVGHGEMIGGSALLGCKIQVGTGFGQIAGDGFSVAVEDLIHLSRQDPAVQALFACNEQFIFAQAQQTAACNAKHRIAERLARWILRARDVVGSDEVRMTQESIAQMLGVQRASISVFANALQAEGLIIYRRGTIRIVDPAGLERHACSCHRLLHSMRDRILGMPVEADETNSRHADALRVGVS